MSMENPNPEYFEQLKKGHITPLEGEDVEEVKKGDETLQKTRSLKGFKNYLESIIKKLKRDTGENLEDVKTE